ncbi:MAG: SGNH/GDSL hydrolase family protein [Lachnospiraceae bacterium]|nr:SGNH/GDSL hydrolase family protein [Lachnospiraceae bacterium]
MKKLSVINKTKIKREHILPTVVIILFVLTVGVVLYAGAITRLKEEEPTADIKEDVNDLETIVIADDEEPEAESSESEVPVADIEEWEYKSEATEEEKLSISERLERVAGLSPEHSTGYIFVGDSRFVNMNSVCEISDRENLFMVAKVGEGYSWFNSTGLSQVKRIVSSRLFGKWKLIICLGVNDLENIDKYKAKYNELKENYDITLVSVNPITKYGNLSNEKIVRFNSSLKEVELPYIDTYNMLLTTGFSTTDGLHYSADTTKKIYSGILVGLEDQDPNALSADADSVLSKANLNTKKALQREIIAANKYIPPVKETTAATAAASANKTETTSATTDATTTTKTQETQETQQETQEVDTLAQKAAENGMTEEEFLDYLYGRSNKDESENPEGESEEQPEEESHEEESEEED